MEDGGCTIPANRIRIEVKKGLMTAAIGGVLEKAAMTKPSDTE
jgi:hypothetical protein